MKPEARQIQLMVAHHYEMTRKQLLRYRRFKSIARPRMVAMALCRFLTDMSLPEIGTAFGGFDHTTVMNAVKRVRQLLADADPQVTRAVLFVRERYKDLPQYDIDDEEEDAFVRHCIVAGVREPPPIRVPKRQCAECPWSKDAPRGLFSPGRFEELLSTEDPAGAIFACHKSTAGNDIPCAGWLEYQRGPNGHNVRVRLAMAKANAYEPPELLGGQFPTYNEMAAAHIAVWNAENLADRNDLSGWNDKGNS